MGQRELAEEEAAVWLATDAEARKPYKGGIGAYWNARDTERSQYQVAQRHTVWRVRNEALWEEVRLGMPIGTAANLVHTARAKSISFEEAIRQHKAGSFTVRTADGRVIHKHKVATEPAAPAPSSEPPEVANEWTVLRELIEELARRALSGEDPSTTEPLITNFLIDVKEGIAYMRRTLQRKGEFTVKRRQVIDACRFLRLEPPPVGTPANEDVFRKNAKQLRYENHQDRLGAAYDNEYYLSIGRAQDYLEQYNQVIGGAPCPQNSKT
jgi:hypothetical protein